MGVEGEAPGSHAARRLRWRLTGVLALLIFIAAQYFPAYNWDLVGYTAAAHALNHSDAGIIHARTIASLKASLPEQHYLRITEEPGYRSQIYSDHQALRAQIPFYSHRIVYVRLLQLGMTLGLDPVRTNALISGLSVALGMLLLFWAFALSSWRDWGLAITALVISSATSLACQVRPDALAFLANTAVFVAYVRGHRRSALMLGALLPLIRTDLALLSLALGTVALLRNEARAWAVASGVVAFACQQMAQKWAGAHSYGTVLFLTFTTEAHMPGVALRALTLQEFTDALIYGTVKALKDMRYPLLMLLGWLYWRRSRSITGDARLTLVLASMLYINIHFLLFPAMWSRFFAAEYWLLTFLPLAALLKPQTQPMPAMYVATEQGRAGS